MKQISFILLLLGFVHVSTLHAQTVYKGLDKDGNVVFSDKPFENSEKIELTPLPSYSTPSIPASNLEEQQKAVPVEYQVQITSPLDQQTFSSSTQDIAVNVSVSPKLGENELVVLNVNGQPQSEPTKNLTFNLGHLSRGQYDLVAQVVNRNTNNSPIATSKQITIYQQRAKVN